MSKMASVKLYVSDLSSSRDIKNKQAQAELILKGRSIEYEKVDISENTELRQKMRTLTNNPTALPPQLFHEDVYLGDYNALVQANETDELMSFLNAEGQNREKTTPVMTSNSIFMIGSSELKAKVEQRKSNTIQLPVSSESSIQDEHTNDDSTAISTDNYEQLGNSASAADDQQMFVSKATFVMKTP